MGIFSQYTVQEGGCYCGPEVNLLLGRQPRITIWMNMDPELHKIKGQYDPFYTFQYHANLCLTQPRKRSFYFEESLDPKVATITPIACNKERLVPQRTIAVLIEAVFAYNLKERCRRSLAAEAAAGFRTKPPSHSEEDHTPAGRSADQHIIPRLDSLTPWWIILGALYLVPFRRATGRSSRAGTEFRRAPGPAESWAVGGEGMETGDKDVEADRSVETVATCDGNLQVGQEADRAE
ncbi:hypothetical protein CHARACLAT_006636 [Characodon lateralis]|uniref:Uncharacterized protein n=1 Tax=Characodon lateralis TaxID=208331 RepID=A0ABU7ERF8_9TELE|nr:hypothetical protein [Characodon lateralis]